MNFSMRKYLLSKDIEFKDEEKNYQLKECPSCGNSKYKFGISKDREFVSHCFKCGESFSIYQLIMLLEDISFKRAHRFVNQKSSRRVSKVYHIKKKDLVREKKKQPFDYSASYRQFPKEFEQLNEQNTYTRKRDLTFATIRAFNLHICHYDKWKGRLIIPVYYHGKLVGWQGRDMTGKAKQKIKSCKGFKKSKFIMNYDNIVNAPRAVLCEGPFDVMKAYQSTKLVTPFGIMGKEMSKDQLNLLLKTKLKRIYIGLDPDFPESREKAAKMLMPYFEVLMVPIPEGVDIGAMDEECIKRCLRASKRPQTRYQLT